MFLPEFEGISGANTKVDVNSDSPYIEIYKFFHKVIDPYEYMLYGEGRKTQESLEKEVDFVTGNVWGEAFTDESYTYMGADWNKEAGLISSSAGSSSTGVGYEYDDYRPDTRVESDPYANLTREEAEELKQRELRKQRAAYAGINKVEDISSLYYNDILGKYEKKKVLSKGEIQRFSRYRYSREGTLTYLEYNYIAPTWDVGSLNIFPFLKNNLVSIETTEEFCGINECIITLNITDANKELFFNQFNVDYLVYKKNRADKDIYRAFDDIFEKNNTFMIILGKNFTAVEGVNAVSGANKNYRCHFMGYVHELRKSFTNDGLIVEVVLKGIEQIMNELKINHTVEKPTGKLDTLRSILGEDNVNRAINRARIKTYGSINPAKRNRTASELVDMELYVQNFLAKHRGIGQQAIIDELFRDTYTGKRINEINVTDAYNTVKRLSGATETSIETDLLKEPEELKENIDNELAATIHLYYKAIDIPKIIYVYFRTRSMSYNPSDIVVWGEGDVKTPKSKKKKRKKDTERIIKKFFETFGESEEGIYYLSSNYAITKRGHSIITTQIMTKDDLIDYIIEKKLDTRSREELRYWSRNSLLSLIRSRSTIMIDTGDPTIFYIYSNFSMFLNLIERLGYYVMPFDREDDNFYADLVGCDRFTFRLEKFGKNFINIQVNDCEGDYKAKKKTINFKEYRWKLVENRFIKYYLGDSDLFRYSRSIESAVKSEVSSADFEERWQGSLDESVSITPYGSYQKIDWFWYGTIRLAPLSYKNIDIDALDDKKREDYEKDIITLKIAIDDSYVTISRMSNRSISFGLNEESIELIDDWAKHYGFINEFDEDQGGFYTNSLEHSADLKTTYDRLESIKKVEVKKSISYNGKQISFTKTVKREGKDSEKFDSRLIFAKLNLVPGRRYYRKKIYMPSREQLDQLVEKLSPEKKSYLEQLLRIYNFGIDDVIKATVCNLVIDVDSVVFTLDDKFDDVFPPQVTAYELVYSLIANSRECPFTAMLPSEGIGGILMTATPDYNKLVTSAGEEVIMESVGEEEDDYGKPFLIYNFQSNKESLEDIIRGRDKEGKELKPFSSIISQTYLSKFIVNEATYTASGKTLWELLQNIAESLGCFCFSSWYFSAAKFRKNQPYTFLDKDNVTSVNHYLYFVSKEEWFNYVLKHNTKFFKGSSNLLLFNPLGLNREEEKIISSYTNYMIPILNADIQKKNVELKIIDGVIFNKDANVNDNRYEIDEDNFKLSQKKTFGKMTDEKWRKASQMRTGFWNSYNNYYYGPNRRRAKRY